MKNLITYIGVTTILLFFGTNIFSQSAGDYRSAANGDWSTAATWEVFDGAVWNAAVAPPTGSENITVDDTVTVSTDVIVTGYVTLADPGAILIAGGIPPGSLSFDNGSTYEHAVNGGDIPIATWLTGSTCLVTGVTGSSPGNSVQDFYNFTWNCAGQSSNVDVGWSGNTIGGNVTCSSTGGGSSQFRLTSSSKYTDSITISGDVILTDGNLTVTGSSTAMVYKVFVGGNITVTGGSFALSRGSGGNAIWDLKGNLSVTNAQVRSSNSDAKFVFSRSGNQTLSYEGVSYSGTFNYEVASTCSLDVADGADAIDLSVNGTVTNAGYISATGVIDFLSGSVYNHTTNGSSVPIATWESGSTTMFTGVTSTAPGNRNQSFYNVIWNCPNQSSNLNMGFDEVTIGGDITIENTGASNRWYLCGPPNGDTATVTIEGNIIQNAGQFSSNGTGNVCTIFVTVNGDITVNAGNFAVSRGSQGGIGTTTWMLNGTNFTMSDATTQNSNSAGAKFVFSGSSTQNLNLTNVNFSSGFPVEVASGSDLNVGTSQIGGSGLFTINDGATLQCANEGGLDSTLQMSGTITLSTAGNYTFNGSATQVTGSMLPATVNDLTVNNSAGVTLSGDVQVDGNLTLTDGDLNLNGHIVTLGTSGTLNESAGNTVTGTTGMLTTTRDINAPAGDNIGGLGAMLTSSANLGSTTIERHHFAGTGDGNQGILRVFNISPTTNSGLDATLRFYYDESELNGSTEDNLIFFRSLDAIDGNWTNRGGTVNTTDNYVELSGIDAFSYWTLADVNTPIPVELTDFNALVDGKVVTLNWKTATETQNHGWEIERKAVIENQSEGNWIKIGFIEGKGNSTETQSYIFKDGNLTSGSYQYRLKQIDYNGTSTYSKVLEINIIIAPKEFALAQNYPNPFNPKTTIEFEVPNTSMVNITIYNTLGETVKVLLNEQMEQGVYTRTFSGLNLPSGIYIYRLSAGNVVFTKKMMLIK